MWSVRVATVIVEKKDVLHILSVCFVALGMEHAPFYIVICGLSVSAVSFHITLINYKIFEREKKVTERTLCVLIFNTTFV